MKWKCPECGLENSDKFLECTCGYAYYKMLGIKPGTSPEEVHQTYQYLKNVWAENVQSKDPIMKQKALERMKKIEQAYEIFKHFAPAPIEPEKKPSFIKTASIVGIAIIVVAGILIFFFLSRKETSRQQLSQTQGKAVIPSDQFEEQYSPLGAQEQYPEEDYQMQPDNGLSEDGTISGEDEEAIELVKRSHGIDRYYADEFRILDWEAKKIDDQKYLVSFTAFNGSGTSEFFFDTNIETGSVRHITDRRELQRYGIQASVFAGYRLDVTVPEFVEENEEFEAQVIITGKPNIKIPITEKLFFIQSNGCEIKSINGNSPRRMSEIFQEYSNLRGTPRDPYVPSDEFIVLDSRGYVEIPVTMKAGSDSDSMPIVGGRSDGHGCTLEVSVGTGTKVATWVIVDKG